MIKKATFERHNFRTGLRAICIAIGMLLGSSDFTDCVGQELNFTLDGMAGTGLTAANEPADVVDGGSGDMGPLGISVDLSTRLLSIDVHWGSANGYEDLSSDVDFMNLHGPTTVQAPGNFAESAGVVTDLAPFQPSASSGGFTGDVKLTGEQLQDLLEGRYYVHLHTFTNPNGEARGYVIPNVVVGDANGDGLINLQDVAPFINAIGSAEFIEEADINRDNSVDLLDVGPFINLLSG